MGEHENYFRDMLIDYEPNPQVVIRVSVTMPDGTVIEKVQVEDENLWTRGYRKFYKGRVIRKLAEDVADEVDRQS